MDTLFLFVLFVANRITQLILAYFCSEKNKSFYEASPIFYKRTKTENIRKQY